MTTTTTVVLFVCLCYINDAVSGVAIIEVKPYPALIYHGAGPNTPVLSVTAYDNDTGQPLQNVALTNGEHEKYFELVQQRKVPREWILQVKQTIVNVSGDQFQFSVYGYYNQTPEDRRILINVTEMNEFAPSFIQTEYTFVALRSGFDHQLVDIGSVQAYDADVEYYNQQFHYHILDPFATRFFHVDLETGVLEMIRNLPDGISNITFSVTAIDGGSPQRLNHTDVTVIITDLPPPDVFCVAVEENVARICWKDPTNGSYVMKYELLFQLDGKNATTVPVRVDGVKDETCSIVEGKQLGRSYTFTVRVLNALEWSPESLQRKVTIQKKGLYGDCPLFSNCSVWDPCQNEGECLVNPDMSYTCNCSSGWGGVNCTGVDLCASSPCENGGTCQYTGDRKYTCQCPDTHYGNYCQYYNACSSNVCKNAADCIIHDNNNFTCVCKSHYIGMFCETFDPCRPSSCVNNGRCAVQGGNNFTCKCPSGYFGRFCEKEDICILDKPCNFGKCTLINSTSGEFECTCDPGYRGSTCDRIDMCEMKKLDGTILCQNNAECLYKEFSSYSCVCPPGYWGGECQHFDPCFNKPCITGKCVNTSDVSYICDCNNGHFGRHCERYDPCFRRPCHSDSSLCYNITDTEYYCECSVERFGKNCEKIDGCNIHFCHNNSTCKNISDTGDIQCFCKPAYSGKFCDIYDPCFLSPCQNSGTCLNLSPDFNCVCAEGYVGSRCQFSDPCLNSPCWNNGTCILESDYSNMYQCVCDKKFYGDFCENAHFCQLLDFCENGGTCSVVEGLTSYSVNFSAILGDSENYKVTNKPTCACLHGYIGDRCQKLSPCVNNPCGEGQCEQKGEGHVCKCPDKTERAHCDEVFCEEDGSYYDKTGRYVWPRTKSGDEARVTCKYGPKNLFTLGYATRTCGVSFSGTPLWETPDSSGCMQLEETEVSANLKNLASLTRDASDLKPEHIANITSTLEEYFAFSLDNIEIAKEMTSVVGNLLDANESAMIESNFQNHSSERLLWILDEYGSKVNLTDDIVIETENINIHISSNSQANQPLIYQPKLDQSNNKQQGGVSLTLPPEALGANGAQEYPRVRLMAFRSSSFFIPEDAPPQEVVNRQWVVSAVVQDRKLDNLTTPVEILIKNIQDGVNHSCAYWLEKNKTWDNTGVVTAEQGLNFTRCLSYHLTSFAILLDPSPEHALSGRHEMILTFISYIGCGVSILGLTLTLITYSIFRCLNREKSGKILMNLCGSMLIMNVVFILGSETSLSLSGDAMCKAVAILLHYFLLTTLTWMLVEAINMYQALITVFTKYSGFFMLKRCIFAWGAPSIVVIATMSVNIDNYKTTTEFCFLSQGNAIAFYIALLGPACLILLINFAVFIMVSRVILRPKFHGQVGKNATDTLNPAQIRGAFTVMTLLGVTWVFGPFAIKEAKLVVNYVFTILNSLQGFLIFVFRCCFNPEVRMAWVVLIKTGKFKRRKGPVTAYTSESTSSKSGESKLNGSYTDTKKSNVYDSLGKQRHVLNNDKNLVTKNTNVNSKASKEMHGYFDDLNRYRGSESRSRSGSSDNTRLYSRNNVTNGRNGHYDNGHSVRNPDSDSNGITTIYTGKYNGVRKSSGYVPEHDEFTRL